MLCVQTVFGTLMQEENEFKLDPRLKKLKKTHRTWRLAPSPLWKLLQGPKVLFKKLTFFLGHTGSFVCLNRKKPHLRLFLVEAVFTLTSLTNRAHLDFWPSGAYVQYVDLIHTRWLFHVHKAMKHPSHLRAEMSFLQSGVTYIHRSTRLTVRLTLCYLYLCCSALF